MSTKRIEFIDLAKGICMMFIILGHCGVNTLIPGFTAMQMPMFFILSGLFFKPIVSNKQFLVKKINTLLVPFILFYLISYAIFYLLVILTPNLIKTPASGILDVFTQRQYFNGPIWFLLVLFWDNIILQFIVQLQKLLPFRLPTYIPIILIGLTGYVLGINNIFVPCMFDVAMSSLPFFFIGYKLQEIDFSYNYNKILLIAISLIAFAIVYAIEYYFSSSHIGFVRNIYFGSLPLIYINILLSVVGMIALCKVINKLPFICWFGEYSIIPLCIHHLIYRPLMVLIKGFEYSNLIVGVLTIIISALFIPIIVKYTPVLVGKKHLIKI